MDIKHIRCGNKAEREGITINYDYYCPSCDEDLCLTECSFKVGEEFKTFEQLVTYVEHNSEIFVEQLEDGTFVGNWRGEQSSLNFEYIADCYVYCHEFIDNGFKSL